MSIYGLTWQLHLVVVSTRLLLACGSVILNMHLPLCELQWLLQFLPLRPIPAGKKEKRIVEVIPPSFSFWTLPRCCIHQYCSQPTSQKADIGLHQLPRMLELVVFISMTMCPDKMCGLIPN